MLSMLVDGYSVHTCVQTVRLRAGFALAVFAFNSTPQQYAIRQAGGLGLECFELFLESHDEIERATAAFQVVPLLELLYYSNYYDKY